MAARSAFRFTLLRKTLLLGFILAAFSVPSLGDDWNYQQTYHDTHDFVAGGSVHVHMTVGSVRIRRGDSDKINLEYTIKSRSEKNVKEARVDFDVHGKDATLEFHSSASGNTNFEVTIEVPQNTNLDVHEKVGDLIVEHSIAGDKYLDLGVGDIRVGNSPTGYRLINASSGIGDVNGAGYGQASGWLGKSLRYHGEGKYELRAHVGVGDIHLDAK
jgi:Putative adhesin